MKRSINLVSLLLLIFASIQANGQFDLRADIALSIDAATFSENEQALIFYNGTAVQYFSLIAETEPAFSINGVPNYPNWELISAAMPWGNDQILLFNGNEYIIYSSSEDSFIESGTWSGLPDEWGGGLDAACQWSSDTYLFFYGREYVSYNSETDTYGEVDVIGNWEGWPSVWNDGIDAVANAGAGIIFFFRGPAYVAYDMESGKFETPVRTASN